MLRVTRPLPNCDAVLVCVMLKDERNHSRNPNPKRNVICELAQHQNLNYFFLGPSATFPPKISQVVFK